MLFGLDKAQVNISSAAQNFYIKSSILENTVHLYDYQGIGNSKQHYRVIIIVGKPSQLIARY